MNTTEALQALHEHQSAAARLAGLANELRNETRYERVVLLIDQCRQCLQICACNAAYLSLEAGKP